KRTYTKDNNFLEEFKLSEIHTALKGVLQIEDTFDIDANGILNVLEIQLLLSLLLPFS
ncbi:14383_t:CDS:1, partial [Funneliformis caledonium]